MAEAGESGNTLKRTLGPINLIALGIGAIIGAGLFVRTAAAAAQNAGPSVTIGFIVASIGCAFAGLCYAEFASMIPIAGSAYTYSYATMGEFIAWIIGWDLILEYGVGAATVAIAWSEYFNKLLGIFGWNIPYEWSHSPFEKLTNTGNLPDYNEKGPKLEISGIVYQRDGKTPAKACCMSTILIRPVIIRQPPMQKAGRNVMAGFVVG